MISDDLFSKVVQYSRNLLLQEDGIKSPSTEQIMKKLADMVINQVEITEPEIDVINDARRKAVLELEASVLQKRIDEISKEIGTVQVLAGTLKQ